MPTIPTLSISTLRFFYQTNIFLHAKVGQKPQRHWWYSQNTKYFPLPITSIHSVTGLYSKELRGVYCTMFTWWWGPALPRSWT